MSSLILTALDFIGCFVFYLTGEILLYIVTFGKHRVMNPKVRFGAVSQLYFEFSYYIGIVFWLGVLVGVKKYVF